MKFRILVLAALAAHAAPWYAPMAAAQAPMAPAPKSATAVSRSERSFVQAAAQAGMAEIEMAKVAQQRGGSAEIQSFADRMIADHRKANRALAGIASAKGMAMPTDLAGADKRGLAKLKTLSGRAFDKEFLDAEVSAHKQAVSLFEEQADHGRDADLRAFAASTLPTLQEHLKMVITLRRTRR